jgi:hypothetical protein
LAALLLACSSSAYAQRTQHFDRVVTGGRTQVQSSAASAEPGTARASLAASSRARSTAKKPLGAPTTEARRAVATSPGARGSTWEQEPQRPATTPAAVTATRPHNYYPGMRPGRAAQRPVTFSANRAAGTVGGVPCMPGGGQSSAGGAAGHHR